MHSPHILQKIGSQQVIINDADNIFLVIKLVEIVGPSWMYTKTLHQDQMRAQRIKQGYWVAHYILIKK